jgi:PTH1 family peptidyl-tRNA hydrolase
MKIVVGIGNPGKRYDATRHNLGFRVVDRLAAENGVDLTRRRFDALVGDGAIGAQRVLLVKPQTYVNLSGSAVAPLLRWHRGSLDDLLVVCDDLNLPLGTMRLRRGGGSGGHNGLKSIADCLGSEAFARLRLGISRPEGPDAVGHVLGRFAPDEAKHAAAAVALAIQAVRLWLDQGIEAAMNEFNA